MNALAQAMLSEHSATGSFLSGISPFPQRFFARGRAEERAVVQLRFPVSPRLCPRSCMANARSEEYSTGAEFCGVFVYFESVSAEGEANE